MSIFQLSRNLVKIVFFSILLNIYFHKKLKALFVSDVMFVIRPHRVDFYCNPLVIRHFLPYIGSWENLKIHCLKDNEVSIFWQMKTISQHFLFILSFHWFLNRFWILMMVMIWMESLLSNIGFSNIMLGKFK